ncbi:cupin-like domain-containing protein [Variovorax sp. LT1R16]|uniref:cupin-like domain-containing protein n=1 Tax=Variovorax sp. LT1R16 TaxID=3443728 RepID=UPI003F44F35A
MAHNGSSATSVAPSRVAAVWRPIEKIDAESLSYEQFLASYMRPNRPVVISRVGKQWAAMRQWTPSHFRQRFGSKPMPIAYDQTLPFDEFIDRVIASSADAPGPYMHRSFLHEVLPELLPDLIPQNPYAFPRRYASPLMPSRWQRPDGYLKLLVGGVGSKFPVMHYDGEAAHAAITEIYGDKEFIMYAPEDGPNLYPRPERLNQSSVDDPSMQDLERFPLLAHAVQYRTVLKPGDMIFVPAGWWHAARALTVSISVCTNMLDGPHWKGLSADAYGTPASHPDMKSRLKRSWMQGLGALLDVLERLQVEQPALARMLVFPARLAPISAAIAPEPSRRQIHLRRPTN